MKEPRDKVVDVEKSLDRKLSMRAWNLKEFLDRLMPLALILLTSLILFHFLIPVGQGIAIVVNYINISLIIFFGIRVLLGLFLAKKKTRYMRNHWFDFLLILPALVLLREIRLFALLESRAEERTLFGFLFARNTTLAGQITKMYSWIRRIFRF